MSLTVGLDIGAGATKGALMADGTRVVSLALAPTRGNPARAGQQVLDELLHEGNVLPGELDYLITTGFGRYTFDGRQFQVSDITASARGASYLHHATRCVLDIGTQSTRAMRVDERGRILQFKVNEKCAAGAGRFVERCSKYLQVPLDQMGPVSVGAAQPRAISSVCAVLAETEIINYVAEGSGAPDILMGVFRSLAQRGHALLKNAGVAPDLTLVGGLVHNEGVVRALREVTGLEVHVDKRAHHAAAIGAAMLAHARKAKIDAHQPLAPGVRA